MSETNTLASFVVTSRMETIPGDVRHEARRAILNYLGCAVGGCRQPAVETAIRALASCFGGPAAGLIGRTERMDPLHAALINGISSHVYEYDDTTPNNYIHPSPPVASALFAYASSHSVPGLEFLHAFIMGFEVESRVGNAVYPAHYEAGWHITATAGVFGAAAAVGRLLSLSAGQMIWAMGLASTQASGLREMFGSMAKSFHAGRAAQNGYASALLAQAGFTAGEQALEGPRGFAAVQAARYDLSRITADLGVDFQIRSNTYKPYPCGLVVHPTIDGAIEIHRRYAPSAEEIRVVRVRVAPLVLDLCNKRHIKTGLESKYSVYHSAAVGLVRGKAGLQEYTDEAVNDPEIQRVRECVSAASDPAITEDQSHLEVELVDGRRIDYFVEQSLGNLKRPLSDRQLEEKFLDQALLAIPGSQAEKLIRLCWRIDELDDVSEIVRCTVPGWRD